MQFDKTAPTWQRRRNHKISVCQFVSTTSTLRLMRSPRSATRCRRFSLLAAILLAAGVVLACGSSDDDEADATPTSQEKVAYCENLGKTTTSLGAMKSALVPIDQVALVDARQDAAAYIEVLRFPAEQLQGGGDALDTLKRDLDELNKLFATQDLSANADAIRSQAIVIESDLQEMKELGSCP